MTILLDGTVTGDTTSNEITGKGGQVVVVVRGNLDSGTIAIQGASSNDSLDRFAAFTNASALATNTTLVLDYIPVGLRLRAVLTGSTTPTDVFVEIIGSAA